ncbi:MAG: type II secretion system F family protein [Abditibacteriales bacterium]|nr:type II secretion system F family protein [Abditibacteriales bacterium]MDW8367905.1 type II secretion system F family protein [Abditibacteriales bacterium]
MASRVRTLSPRERIERLKAKDRHLASLYRPAESQPLLVRLLRALLGRWTERIGRRRTGEDRIREKLMRAGFPLGLRAREFIALRQIVGMLAFLLTLGLTRLMATQLEIQPIHYALYGLAGGYFGAFLPMMVLNSLIAKRQRQVEIHLPDFIDLLTVSVEAGLALDAALQRVAGEFPGPLGEEGLRIVGELRVGRTRAEALREMARRLDIPELTSFVTMIVQAEQIGASIGNALRIQSQQIRELRALRARERAQQAPVKITIVLIFFILPLLGIVIVAPTLIAAWENLQSAFG